MPHIYEQTINSTYKNALIRLVIHDKYEIKETNLYPEYSIEFFNGDNKSVYEVRADKYSYKTNNIVIDYEHSGYPSGILTSKAQYYAYFVSKPFKDYDLYIIPTDKIKQEVDNKTYKMALDGNDNDQTKMYIFNKDIYSEYKQKKQY